jgi:ethanolamine ammonia-lyase large subunit
LQTGVCSNRLPGYSISTCKAYALSVGNQQYRFADQRDLLAKPTRLRSGSALAETSSDSAEQRVSALLAPAPMANNRILFANRASA